VPSPRAVALALALLASGTCHAQSISVGAGDSARVVASTGFSQAANTSGAGAGSVTFNLFSIAASTESGALTTLFFTVGTSWDTTTLSLTPTKGGAEDGTNILARLIPRGLDGCVASLAKWGDVNDDGMVSNIDAQQIARYSVVLTTPSPHSALPKGQSSRIEAPSWAEWPSSCLTPAAPVAQ
jgi:hypothetical protein